MVNEIYGLQNVMKWGFSQNGTAYNVMVPVLSALRTNVQAHHNLLCIKMQHHAPNTLKYSTSTLYTFTKFHIF